MQLRHPRAAVMLVLLALLAQPEAAIDLSPVDGAMRTPGVHVTAHWEDCGEVNAYYTIATRTITLCNELRPLGEGFIRFVYAHEYAHAIIHQRTIPYTGSEETAADELAAVMLLLYGHQQEVFITADFWWRRAKDMPPDEDHPDDQERGFRLACLYWGYRNENEGCYHRWVHSRDSWMRMLGYY